MIAAVEVELRAGSRLLLQHATFRVAGGEKVGLVGRNGAGKTTLTKVLAGVGEPVFGTVTRAGSIGYLPQDPRTGDLDEVALARILSARGLDTITGQLRDAEQQMASRQDDSRDRAMRRYARLEAEFVYSGRRLRRSRVHRFPDCLQPWPVRASAGAGTWDAVRWATTASRVGPDPIQ